MFAVSAIAIEPLAAMIRSNPTIQGFQYGERQDKITLCADDTILLLGNTNTSLQEAISFITSFGNYSGLHINWSKSAIVLLDAQSGDSGPALHNIPVASKFKYLGNNVTPRPLDYVLLNLSPLIRMRTRSKYGPNLSCRW